VTELCTQQDQFMHHPQCYAAIRDPRYLPAILVHCIRVHRDEQGKKIFDIVRRFGSGLLTALTMQRKLLCQRSDGFDYDSAIYWADS
jgi:hypothetical protein